MSRKSKTLVYNQETLGMQVSQSYSRTPRSNCQACDLVHTPASELRVPHYDFEFLDKLTNRDLFYPQYSSKILEIRVGGIAQW